MGDFNYCGHSNDELIDLCSEEKVDRGPAKWLYWTAEVYSIGRHLRDYGFYPKWLPLNVYTGHGPGHPKDIKVMEHEINNDAYCHLPNSKKTIELYKKFSKKPCFQLYSPFVHYRRKNKIKQSPNAKGTLVFPAHSLPGFDNISDINEYIRQLKELPEEFKPVCVCLHMHDIHKDQQKIFLDNDIPVYTAGNAFDVRFAERFYDILKNFRYTMSNLAGSYVYYSVEMGIPFTIYGIKPKYLNVSLPS